jgi:hypothetical protein
VSNKFKAIAGVVQAIGLYEIISIIIGVPSVIVLIIDIWHSLSRNRQIIAVIVIILILSGVGLFISSQIKKRLYRIPKILHQMHKRTLELVSTLDAMALSEADFTSFMSLVSIDTAQLFSSIKDLESLAASVPEIVKTAETQSEKLKDEKETPQRVFYLLYDKMGLKGALESDKQYQKLKRSLDNLMPIVPTKEISEAVLEYEKSSRIAGTFLPLFRTSNEQVLQILPLQYKIDQTRLTETTEERMTILLSKVWEAIDKYYKGD